MGMAKVYIDVQSFVPGYWGVYICRRQIVRFFSLTLLLGASLLFHCVDYCIRVELNTSWLLYSARLLDSNKSICLGPVTSGGDGHTSGID
jgi:hypothetical protein